MELSLHSSQVAFAVAFAVPVDAFAVPVDALAVPAPGSEDGGVPSVKAFESTVPALRAPTSGVPSVDAKVTSDSGNAFEVPRDAVGGESTLPGSSTLGVPSAAVVEVAIGAPLVAKVAPAVTVASDEYTGATRDADSESTVPRAAAASAVAY